MEILDFTNIKMICSLKTQKGGKMPQDRKIIFLMHMSDKGHIIHVEVLIRQLN